MHILINNDGKHDFQFETSTKPEEETVLRILSIGHPEFPKGTYTILRVSNKLGGLSGVFSFEIWIEKISDDVYEPAVTPPLFITFVSVYK